MVQGRYAEAVPLLEEGVALKPSPAPHLLLSYGVVNLGWARLGLDELGGARDAFRRAYAEAGSGDRQISARALDALATVAVRQGDAHRGALLFGAAEGIRRSIGVEVWVTDAAGHDRAEAAMRAALGDEAFRAAVEAGLHLTAEVIVSIAFAGGAGQPA